MIHVAYRLWGGDGFYAKMCGTSMLSMFENTREKVTVHIMHNDRLTPDNRGKFCYIAGQYNQRVEFHNVEEIAGATLRKFEAAYPIKSGINAAWYPLIVHEVFPNLDKLIFLGTDTIIHLDIGELWSYDLERLEYPIAAVSEYFMKGEHEVLPITRDGYASHENCFNSDVMLVNPKLFHEMFDVILDACKFVYEKKYFLNEQDTLNYVFADKYLHLPSKFNMILFQLRRWHPEPYYLEEAIYHFNVWKPRLNAKDVFDRLYLEYFLKTPWADVEMFRNIDRAFKNMYDFIKQQMLNYTNLLSERERVFLTDKNNTEQMRKTFKIKEDEWLVDVTKPDVMKNFFELCESFKGRKTIFILAKHEELKRELRQRGFVEGYDFMDARIFLSENEGGKWLIYDSHDIVREM